MGSDLLVCFSFAENKLSAFRSELMKMFVSPEQLSTRLQPHAHKHCCTISAKIIISHDSRTIAHRLSTDKQQSSGATGPPLNSYLQKPVLCKKGENVQMDNVSFPPPKSRSATTKHLNRLDWADQASCIMFSYCILIECICSSLTYFYLILLLCLVYLFINFITLHFLWEVR